MKAQVLALAFSVFFNPAPTAPSHPLPVTTPTQPAWIGKVNSVQLPPIAPVDFKPLETLEPVIVGGNDYTWGNCTWYVANKRPVPAGWGNARDWLASAQAMGVKTGPEPRVGAIAWKEPGYSLGHVAYVEAVYPDGSFLISEMNVVGLDATDTQVVTPEGWYFIYGGV